MKYAAILFALLTSTCWSQSTAKTDNNTSGLCSPITTGNSNTYKIQCNIDTERGREMLEIMNKILSNQLNADVVMAKLDEIQTDVRKLRSGVYSGYDFNGAKREQRPGYARVTVGAETVVFQNMIKLQANQQWKALLTISEDQIRKTPDWLTPYLFSGLANANLGNTEAAIQRLTFVRDKAVGNPDYADAARILLQLQK